MKTVSSRMKYVNDHAEKVVREPATQAPQEAHSLYQSLICNKGSFLRM